MFRIALVPFLVAGLATAAAPAHAQADAVDFRALELEWMDALAEKDKPKLERILAPEFTIIGATSTAEDPVGSRANWLEIGLKRPFPRHEVIVHRATRIDDLAVVQATLSGTYPPSPFAPNGGPVSFLVTDTWVLRDGTWQVVARHSSFPAKE